MLQEPQHLVGVLVHPSCIGLALSLDPVSSAPRRAVQCQGKTTVATP